MWSLSEMGSATETEDGCDADSIVAGIAAAVDAAAAVDVDVDVAAAVDDGGDVVQPKCHPSPETAVAASSTRPSPSVRGRQCRGSRVVSAVAWERQECTRSGTPPLRCQSAAD